MSDQFPYSFGKYRMEAEIGRGGFGTVFRAVDLDLDRPVAIKIMDPIYMRDQRWVARFRREGRVMARLEHPHIVPIYEISEEDGRLYLAMKFIDGPDMTTLIKEKGALPWDVVVEMVSQIASALDFAHQQNVVHRDLKPGNILISNGQALLTDFGLAQMVESNSQSVSMTGGVAGTYNYMPPEVFNDEQVTPAADIYALGCVVYEMLDGKMLFDGNTTAAIIGAHLKGITFDEPLPAGTPPGTREVIEIALAKDPQQRYGTATEFAQELQRVATDRLAGTYAQLEQAISGQRWPEALALAAEIQAQDPNYRDIAALEERAHRGQWSAQWLNEAQQGLAANDFDAVRGALSQWRRVDPNNPDILRVEQTLVAKEAAANREEQAAVAAVAAAATVDTVETTPQPAPVSAGPPPQATPPTQTTQPSKGGLPGWIWWIAALVVLLILAFGIRAAFFGGGDDDQPPATQIVTENEEGEAPFEETPAVSDKASEDAAAVAEVAATATPRLTNTPLPPTDRPTITPRPPTETPTPGQVKYTITVHTGCEFLSGTDANVYIKLLGERGESNENLLDNPSVNDFETCDSHTYQLILPDLGEINTVSIRHDNSGLAAGWFLDGVFIRNETTGEERYFSNNRWLATDEDDGQISRDLNPS